MGEPEPVHARFGFGENWRNFLDDVTDERIREAESSLREMLGVDDLSGMTFLDIGCGSGLFSLAALRLGADRVRSLDYDPESVAASSLLREREAPYSNWTIEPGDVLAADYLSSLGEYDIVYAWGVLHHTGAMWDALGHTCDGVADGGVLFVALYNDQGLGSGRWLRVIAKREEIFRFCRDRSFRLVELQTVNGGHGCNQFVFRRADNDQQDPSLATTGRVNSGD